MCPLLCMSSQSSLPIQSAHAARQVCYKTCQMTQREMAGIPCQRRPLLVPTACRFCETCGRNSIPEYRWMLNVRLADFTQEEHCSAFQVRGCPLP